MSEYDTDRMMEHIYRLTRERDDARVEAALHLDRANQEIARRERAEVAYTQSEQKRLVLIDERDEARALLRDLEWAKTKWEGEWCHRCPVCGAVREDRGGHTAWCRIAAALEGR